VSRHPLDALGDLPKALDDLGLPAFAVDRSATLVWLNPAAKALVGDKVGQRTVTLFAPESKRAAQEAFARKIVGTVASTDYEAVVVTQDGHHLPVEVSSVRLERDGHVSGIFGLVEPEEQPVLERTRHLTPRQAQVLAMLAHGCSTNQIADRLSISRETVRNHVRDILKRLGAHSRLEAVLTAREHGLV
jgi:PAS domain S-box-containing protein